MLIKFWISLLLLIDDLTFLIYCQYEFKMSPWEAGALFALSALCLFTYGLTISGYIIDKLGVKWSLMIGLALYALANFMLLFAENRVQLYIVMLTIAPLGISIVVPVLVLAIKRLTKENARPLAFNIFFGAMILGACFGGPTVDWIRHDYKHTSVTYRHTNQETGREEEREQEFSCWRIIQFVGFCILLTMAIALLFYRPEVEQRFVEEDFDQGKYTSHIC